MGPLEPIQGLEGTLVSSVQQSYLSPWPWFDHPSSSLDHQPPSQLAEHDGGEGVELHGEADVPGGRLGQGPGGEGQTLTEKNP